MRKGDHICLWRPEWLPASWLVTAKGDSAGSPVGRPGPEAFEAAERREKERAAKYGKWSPYHTHSFEVPYDKRKISYMPVPVDSVSSEEAYRKTTGATPLIRPRNGFEDAPTGFVLTPSFGGTVG